MPPPPQKLERPVKGNLPPRQFASASDINNNRIDLVYLEPSFSNVRNFHVPIGMSAEGNSFNYNTISRRR